MKVHEQLNDNLDKINAVFLSAIAHLLTTFDFSRHYWTTERTGNQNRYWQEKIVRKPVIEINTPRNPDNLTRF